MNRKDIYRLKKLIVEYLRYKTSGSLKINDSTIFDCCEIESIMCSVKIEDVDKITFKVYHEQHEERYTIEFCLNEEDTLESSFIRFLRLHVLD